MLFRSTPMAAVGSVDSTPYPTPSDLQKEHVAAITELASSHSLQTEGLHTEEGSPAFVINQVADRIGDEDFDVAASRISSRGRPIDNALTQ